MSTARTRANDKYNRKTYEQVAIRVHKGTRDYWKQEAEKRGLSLAGLIVKAVEQYLRQNP